MMANKGLHSKRDKWFCSTGTSGCIILDVRHMTQVRWQVREMTEHWSLTAKPMLALLLKPMTFGHHICLFLKMDKT